MAKLFESVRFLKGVGEARAKSFASIGVRTLYDLISYFPRTYEDRTRIVPIAELQADEPACFRAFVTSNPRTAHIRKGLDLTKLTVADDTARLNLTFFNQNYVADSLRYGEEYYFYGTLNGDYLGYEVANPVFESVDRPGVQTRRIMPIYPLTAGLSNGMLARSVALALEACIGELPELLPAQLREKYGLCDAATAYREIHTPSSFEALDAARRRLVFEEFFIFSVGLSMLRSRRTQAKCQPLTGLELAPFEAVLCSQKRSAGRPDGPHRDPGRAARPLAGAPAGKARCPHDPPDRLDDGGPEAKRPAGHCVPRGRSDHRHPRSDLRGHRLPPAGPGHCRRAASLRRGPARGFGREGREPPHFSDVRHADPPDPCHDPLRRLGRFGDRRAPAGPPARKQAAEGHQVYIVCPAIEEGETESLKSAEVWAETLQMAVFPDLRVALVHGRMKSAQKDEIMRAFADGGYDILVATTVIEVGVDVPNATLMVVENADRFGLSQLHQLRGRVGRGAAQAYCVLFTANRNPETLARLKALCKTTDGFEIARADLNLRGPGDFFGTRQHGLPAFKVGSLVNDMTTLQDAQAEAAAFLSSEELPARPEYAPLMERIRALFAEDSAPN